MKRIIKITALLLAAFQLLPMLIACEQSGTGDTISNDSTSATPESTEVETEAFPAIGNGFITVFTEGILNFATIKYPADPDEVTFSAAQKLYERLKKETGKQLDLKPDYSSDKNPPDSSTFEILIGETNYPETKEALESITYGDYTIKIVGNKLVIVGYTPNEISRAVNYITGTMFKSSITKDENGNPTILIDEYSYIAEKSVEKITIEGIDISEFSIVYGTAEDADANEAIAQRLWASLSQNSHYVIPVIKDTDECKTERKIYVGSSFKNLDSSVKLAEVGIMQYKAVTVGKDFYIIGGGLLSTHLGISEIIKKYILTSGSSKEIAIKAFEGSLLHCAEQKLTDGAEFRVMTYNIMAHWSGWGGDYMPVSQRYEGFKAIMDAYSPDVVGLQEVSAPWSELILEKYGDIYEYVNRKTPDGKFVNLSTIIYKKDKFDLIDSGLKYFDFNGANQIRLVNWAILKDKATGKQFAIFNSHWGGVDSENGTEQKAQAKQHAEIIKSVLAAHPEVKHVFSTADYNSKLDAENTFTFLDSAGLVNSLDIAKASGNLMNEVGGCGTLGVSRLNNTGGGSIDNIFVTNNMQILRHETVLWNGAEHVSDHSAKYADVVLN